MQQLYVQDELAWLIYKRYQTEFDQDSHNRLYQDLRVPLWHRLAVCLADLIFD